MVNGTQTLSHQSQTEHRCYSLRVRNFIESEEDIDAIPVSRTKYKYWLQAPVQRSTRPQDEVDATVRAHDITHLAHGETVRGILERLLHLTTLEPSEISTMRMRTAVRVFLRQLGECLRRAIDLGLILAQDLHGFVLRASDVGLGGMG